MQPNSALMELLKFNEDLSDEAIARLLRLWKKLQESRDLLELVNGFLCLMLILRKGERFSEAWHVQEQFQQIVETRDLNNPNLQKLIFKSKIDLLVASQRFEEYWAILKTQKENIDPDWLHSIVNSLIMQGRTDLAFTAYCAYIASIEVELLLWRLDLIEMDFPHSFWVPDFVFYLFDQGDNAQKLKIARTIMRLVDLYLETYALAIFPYFDSQEAFMERLAKWLAAEGQQTESKKIVHAVKSLKEQWLKSPSPGRSWMYQHRDRSS